jgi:hypothetical protein
MKIKRVEHIAIAVDSLNQSASILRDAFGINIEYEEQVGSTRLAMLPVGETYIELLESAAPDSGVSQWLREKGAGLFRLLARRNPLWAQKTIATGLVTSRQDWLARSADALSGSRHLQSGASGVAPKQSASMA